MGSNFGGALMNMIGDFTNLNRTPDFKAKSDVKPKKNPALASVRLVERRHSLNLAVGVSDEPPPYSAEMRVRLRRQSTTPTTSGMSKAQKQTRRQSAPAQMAADISELHKKMTKLRETSSLKNEIVVEEEPDQEQLSEEEEGLLPPSSLSLRRSAPGTIAKKADEDEIPFGSYSEPSTPILTSPVTRTLIMNNRGHRGSVVIIGDDNDSK